MWQTSFPAEYAAYQCPNHHAKGDGQFPAEYAAYQNRRREQDTASLFPAEYAAYQISESEVAFVFHVSRRIRGLSNR